MKDDIGVYNPWSQKKILMGHVWEWDICPGRTFRIFFRSNPEIPDVAFKFQTRVWLNNLKKIEEHSFADIRKLIESELPFLIVNNFLKFYRFSIFDLKIRIYSLNLVSSSSPNFRIPDKPSGIWGT